MLNPKSQKSTWATKNQRIMTKKQQQILYFIFTFGLIISLLMVWNSNQRLQTQIRTVEHKNKALTKKNSSYKSIIETYKNEESKQRALASKNPVSDEAISKLQEEYYKSIQSKKDQLKELSLLKKQLDSSNQQTSLTKNQIEAKNEAISKLKQTLKQTQNKAVELQFESAEGISVSYFGQVENGVATGFGVGVFEGKGIYRGEWKDNARHGKGTYTWSNGDVYEGQFMKGKIHGFGTYFFKSGEKYVGNWENNLRHGEGAVFNTEGEVLLQGTWQNDKIKKKTK